MVRRSPERAASSAASWRRSGALSPSTRFFGSRGLSRVPRVLLAGTLTFMNVDIDNYSAYVHSPHSDTLAGI